VTLRFTGQALGIGGRRRTEIPNRPATPKEFLTSFLVERLPVIARRRKEEVFLALKGINRQSLKQEPSPLALQGFHRCDVSRMRANVERDFRDRCTALLARLNDVFPKRVG
jgi:hypothetical protein